METNPETLGDAKAEADDLAEKARAAKDRAGELMFAHAKSALDDALKIKNPSELGRALGITREAVSQWDSVPARRVLAVEKETGVSRHDLRPDIYGPKE